MRTEAEQLRRGTAEGELELLGPTEVARQRVLDIHADAAVHVLRGMCHAVAALAGPPLRDGRLVARGRPQGRRGDALVLGAGEVLEVRP